MRYLSPDERARDEPRLLPKRYRSSSPQRSWTPQGQRSRSRSSSRNSSDSDISGCSWRLVSRDDANIDRPAKERDTKSVSPVLEVELDSKILENFGVKKSTSSKEDIMLPEKVANVWQRIVSEGLQKEYMMKLVEQYTPTNTL